MHAESARTIARVVEEHAAEAAQLRSMRSALVRAPHMKLQHLARFDERLRAHLDGIAVAGDAGWRACLRSLEHPGGGEVFTATVRALADRNDAALDRLIALAEALPDVRGGLRSAFGWVAADALQGTIKRLLDAPGAFAREVGIAACAMHGRDPGAALDRSARDPNAPLRARCLRAYGELGRRADRIGDAGLVADDDPACRFWAAWSATLLQRRRDAFEALRAIALEDGPHRGAALRSVLLAADVAQADAILKSLAQQPAQRRLLLTAAGFAGRPEHVPWLVEQMADDVLARAAGEAFSMVTGADLALLDLERKPPAAADLDSGDDDGGDGAAGDDAAGDDEGLPWPDQAKVHAWWAANAQRFEPGTRHFAGAPVSWAHCASVLADGYQRQRIAAAQYLCLLRPGTPLFGCEAPAWRQQRRLAVPQ